MKCYNLIGKKFGKILVLDHGKSTPEKYAQKN